MLLQQEARVGLIGRSVARLDDVARNCPEHVLALPVDVRDRSGLRAAIGQVLSQWKRIDLLVHCAGLTSYAPIEELGEESHDVLDTALLGALWTTQAVLPSMRQ